MVTNVTKTLVGGIERSIILAKVILTDVPTLQDYKGVLKEFEKTEVNNGKFIAIKLWKYWYNFLAKIAMKENSIIDQPPLYNKTNKLGEPKILRPFIRRIRMNQSKNNDLSTRMILTAFRSFESVKLLAIPNLDSIVSPSLGPTNYEEQVRPNFKKFMATNGFIHRVREDFRNHVSDVKRDNPWIAFHYTVKKGISGSALGTAGIQSTYFDNDRALAFNLTEILNHFVRSDNYIDLIDQNSKFYNKAKRDICPPRSIEKIKKYPGRLAFIPDKGGKTRTVAIGNYWVQNALKPLHDCLFKSLRRIAMDGTYDQISQASRVAKATSEGPVWSFDLTTATDRLPLNIQKDVMESLDLNIGLHWGLILDRMTFEFRDKAIKYAVGQPMGLYSSWASLAMTHHFIIQYCAHQEGIDTFMKYSVLGDDVAIWDERVARRYTEFMNILEVKISQTKSYIPNASLMGPWKAEFAKRLFLDGKEISGIGGDVLKEGLKDFWSLPELFIFLTRHGLSEIVQAPVSRVARLLKLRANEISQLSCAFRVSEILGGPHFNVDLPLDTIIADHLNNLTAQRLIGNRFDELTESVLTIQDQSFDLDSQNRAKLEKLLKGGELPDHLCYNRMIETRLNQLLELSFRMAGHANDTAVMMFNIDGAKSQFKDQAEYEDNILTKLKDIEFVPSIDFKDVVKGLTLNTDKKRHRIIYLRKLVLQILSNLSNDNQVKWGYST